MSLSTHILDTTLGKPARGVTVTVEQHGADGSWRELGKGITDADGRIKPLLSTLPSPGRYRLGFAVALYFQLRGVEAFYPAVTIEFTVADPTEHHHVPLLLNPFGYSTYRGS